MTKPVAIRRMDDGRKRVDNARRALTEESFIGTAHIIALLAAEYAYVQCERGHNWQAVRAAVMKSLGEC